MNVLLEIQMHIIISRTNLLSHYKKKMDDARLLIDIKYVYINTYKFLICHNGMFSKLYGGIKVQKQNLSKPVVTNVGSPIYNMACHIATVLNRLK